MKPPMLCIVLDDKRSEFLLARTRLSGLIGRCFMEVLAPPPTPSHRSLTLAGGRGAERPVTCNRNPQGGSVHPSPLPIDRSAASMRLLSASQNAVNRACAMYASPCPSLARPIQHVSVC